MTGQWSCKRDGLVHVSQLSDKWISDPREAVRVGRVVRVRVLEVDRQRGRISLSMRSPEAPSPLGELGKS